MYPKAHSTKQQYGIWSQCVELQCPRFWLCGWAALMGRIILSHLFK